MNALGRPQRGHLLYFLTANFGVLFAFAMSDFLAKPTSDSNDSIVLFIYDFVRKTCFLKQTAI
jgi:hypothetical protein